MKSKFVITVILFVFHQSATAQKLPVKQQSALRTPSSVSIDGNATEWQNEFQAYNKSTQLFYTLSNDDKNLYLILRSIDPLIVKKMLYGITFSLSSDAKRVSAISSSFTFPVIDWKVRSTIVSALDKQVKSRSREMTSDSLINALNKQLNRASRVRTRNLLNIPDTVSLIKDSEIVKAAGKFDNELTFTYELTVPLKDLILKRNKFLYNIKLNGSNTKAKISSDGMATVNDGGGGPAVVLTVSSNDLIVQFPTDFTAQYTLIER